MRASLCVHSWNEGPAVERLILSSLHAIDLVREWVVLDHRSADDTQARLDRVEPLLAQHGVPLVRLFEPRDLSRELTFADVRARTIHACVSNTVALMDADFVLGPDFAPVLQRSMRTLNDRYSRFSTVQFRIPCVWDHLATDEEGRVTRHGRVWWHSFSHRIMRRDSVTYEQTGADGRWERLVKTNKRRQSSERVRNTGSALVSVNVKPRERLDLRATMTFFMEDTMTGRVDGGWLEQYHAAPERLRRMPEYPYDPAADLSRVRLNIANLVLP